MVNSDWFIDRLKDVGLSQREAARRLEMDASAFNLMIHGKRKMMAGEAVKIADLIRQPVEEVMRQAGVSFAAQAETIEVTDLIDDTMALSARPGRSFVPVPASSAQHLAAARVENSASPFFGWTFFYDRRRDIGPDAMGRLCVVTLSDGTRKIRFIQVGVDRRSYRLVSLTGLIEEDIPAFSVTAASPVLWIHV